MVNFSLFILLNAILYSSLTDTVINDICKYYLTNNSPIKLLVYPFLILHNSHLYKAMFINLNRAFQKFYHLISYFKYHCLVQ